MTISTRTLLPGYLLPFLSLLIACGGQREREHDGSFDGRIDRESAHPDVEAISESRDSGGGALDGADGPLSMPQGQDVGGGSDTTGAEVAADIFEADGSLDVNRQSPFDAIGERGVGGGSSTDSSPGDSAGNGGRPFGGGAYPIDGGLSDGPLEDAARVDASNSERPGAGTSSVGGGWPSIDAPLSTPDTGRCSEERLPPSVSIATVTPSGPLDDRIVVVTGTATASTERLGVAVNGVPAMWSGGIFVASRVPLGTEQKLVAIVTDDCGTTATQETIFVASATVDAGQDASSGRLVATATPALGFAPLVVTFSTQPRFAEAGAQIDWDFDGDGKVDLTADGTTGSSTHRYETAGIFVATASLRASGGATLRGTVVVQVTTPAIMDPIIKDTWRRMRDAALAGHTREALDAFAADVRDRYATSFARLGRALPLVLSGTETWQDGKFVGGGVLQYEVIVDYGNGARMAFPRLFGQDTDGLWRIWSL
jgi:hypothetical protein